MTHSCQTCTDPVCDKTGADLRACEHYTEDDELVLGDLSEPNPIDIIVYDLSEKVDALRVDVDRLTVAVNQFTAMVDHLCAAITKWRAGEEL